MRAILSLVCVMIMVQGCSNVIGETGVIRTRGADYTGGANMPALKTPAGMDPISINPYFVIPDVTNNDGSVAVPIPPGSLLMEQTVEKQRKKS